MIVWTRLGLWGLLLFGGIISCYESIFHGRLEGWNYEFGKALTQVIASTLLLIWGLYLHKWNYTKVVDEHGEEIKHAVFGIPMEWFGGAFLLYSLCSFLFLLFHRS
jgi:hypothetical protein